MGGVGIMTEHSFSVAIYVRLSKEDSVDSIRRNKMGKSNSITNQLCLIKSYITSHPDLRTYEIVEYRDDGYSGTDFMRPGIQQLFTDVKNRMIQCILVKDLSRFGRNYLEVGTYLEEVFPLLGVRFISVNDNYDSQQQLPNVNRLDIAVRNLMYDYYSKDLSQKVKASFKIKQEKGDYLGGGIPYGYRRSQTNKGRIEIEPETAEVVRRIFQMTNDGYSRSDIARLLNESGVPAPGNPRYKNKKTYWTLDAVIRILRNEVYIGTAINHKYKVMEIGSRKTTLLPKDKWNMISENHESIVTKELFAVIQKTFRKPKPMQFVNNSTSNNGMLKGKMKCGWCKYSMDLIQAKCPYYQCSSHRFIPNAKCSREHADGKSVEDIVHLVLHNVNLLSIAKDSKQCYRLQDWELKGKHERDVSKTLKQIQQKEVKLYEDYKNMGLCREEYICRKENYRIQKEELQKKGNLLNRERDITMMNHTSREHQQLTSMIKVVYFYDALHLEIVVTKKELDNFLL